MEGANHQNGNVSYAKGTQEALDQLAQAGFMGVIIPHQYGGLNFPATIYFMMIEMISRADASLMTLFGYQDVGEAISKFAPEEIAEKFLPKYTLGEHTGSMVMTEPGAGSDLQAIKMKAYQDQDGQWRLHGEKQFISNGCGQVLLVLARSEPNTSNMFGLSLFACHGGDQVKVNRIEHKMGLNGSPTCALYFDHAPCYLVGKRRHGLIHVLYILNHARFSVAAQALGIAEAAYQEALKYSKIREQFGKLIYEIPSVANLLIEMRVTIECNRTLLYASSQWLDLRNKLEEKLEKLKEAGKDHSEERSRFNQAAKIVDMLSPMAKYIITEDANRICYDAQQVHGGMGYMKDMEVERLVRDVRITTIYEGTSQIQILAAAKGVWTDVLSELFNEMEKHKHPNDLLPLQHDLMELRKIFHKCLEQLKNSSDSAFKEVASKDLVDMYAAIYTGHLILKEANDVPRKKKIANRFIHRALSNANRSQTSILQQHYSDTASVDEICGSL
jgi:alkylation response protein AidB-like acyl-CoA dehydrogenase